MQNENEVKTSGATTAQAPIESGELDFSKIFKTAKRSSVPLKIQMSGVSGSGKTLSSLILAGGLTKKTNDFEKILVVDTEDAASLYAEYNNLVGSFKVANLKPPYEPERGIKLIQLAEKAGVEVLIFDSLTHFWNGKGGILDINNSYGGRFQDWAKTSPRHNAFVEAIKQSNISIISTVRKKTEYAIVNDGSKNRVQKLGLANEQKDNMEYEFTLAFDIDINHLATASKDRTGLFMDRTPFKITCETGLELKAWSTGGSIAKNY